MEIFFFKGMILKETWRLRNTWKIESVHMIVVFWVTALCSDTERQCLGLVSKDLGATLPTIPKGDSPCFTMEKSHSFFQKHLCNILTNVRRYFKTIKEDAQIFSACTGSAW